MWPALCGSCIVLYVEYIYMYIYIFFFFKELTSSSCCCTVLSMVSMSLGLMLDFRLYVAEVNTHTGKMTMYPAEVFNMHPVTEGLCCRVNS